MSFFSQSKFPRLWLLFQYLVGGTADKRRLATMLYNGEKRVLEIGCSAGNVSEAFSGLKQIEFTGIDIDNNALGYAKKRLESLPNFKFRNVALSELAEQGEKYDYVLFANILHHVDNQTALALLRDVQLVLSPRATLIIMEPEKIKENYNLIFKLFYKLEKGQFRRHKSELISLILSAGLPIRKSSDIVVSPNSLPFLKVGTITLIEVSAP